MKKDVEYFRAMQDWLKGEIVYRTKNLETWEEFEPTSRVTEETKRMQTERLKIELGYLEDAWEMACEREMKIWMDTHAEVKSEN